MEYRRLGKSGLPISELSFGSWITFGNQIENNISERFQKNSCKKTTVKLLANWWNLQKKLTFRCPNSA